MTHRYRIGVIGTGARARAFTPALHAGTDRAELAGLCDIDPDHLARYIRADGLEDVPSTTDVRAFLARRDIDAVIVTVPDFAHREVVLAALEAGKPVYLEKPIAHSLDDAWAMVEAQQRHGTLVYLGFNMRAAIAYNRIRDIIHSGVLGQIIHIDATEQLHVDHIASFMRRFHRHSRFNGGLLNQKCSHDLDIMMWLIGHQHRVIRVSSFGGCNVFRPERQPASHCHLCPAQVYRACPYKAPGSDKVRTGEMPPPDVNNAELYPGDLCVFTADKDIVDNQTVIMEWEHGVRGSFNLQGFQHKGARMMRIWGEKGMLDYHALRRPQITVTDSATGDVSAQSFEPRKGGHGGSDALMMDRFLDAIECNDPGDAGLAEGLAATLLAVRAETSRVTGQTITIPRAMYEAPVAPFALSST